MAQTHISMDSFGGPSYSCWISLTMYQCTMIRIPLSPVLNIQPFSSQTVCSHGHQRMPAYTGGELPATAKDPDSIKHHACATVSALKTKHSCWCRGTLATLTIHFGVKIKNKVKVLPILDTCLQETIRSDSHLVHIKVPGLQSQNPLYRHSPSGWQWPGIPGSTWWHLTAVRPTCTKIKGVYLWKSQQNVRTWAG